MVSVPVTGVPVMDLGSRILDLGLAEQTVSDSRNQGVRLKHSSRHSSPAERRQCCASSPTACWAVTELCSSGFWVVPKACLLVCLDQGTPHFHSDLHAASTLVRTH